MAYLYNLPNSTSGLDQIVKDVIGVIPSFPPLILLFVFLVVVLGGISRQKIRTGSADYPMWFVIASISTLLVSLLMSVTSGIIRLDWLSIVVVITIFSAVWFFLSKRSEV